MSPTCNIHIYSILSRDWISFTLNLLYFSWSLYHSFLRVCIACQYFDNCTRMVRLVYMNRSRDNTSIKLQLYFRMNIITLPFVTPSTTTHTYKVLATSWLMFKSFHGWWTLLPPWSIGSLKNNSLYTRACIPLISMILLQVNNTFLSSTDKIKPYTTYHNQNTYIHLHKWYSPGIADII